MVQKGVNAYINIKCHFFNDICKKAPPPLVKRWRSLWGTASMNRTTALLARLKLLVSSDVQNKSGIVACKLDKARGDEDLF